MAAGKPLTPPEARGWVTVTRHGEGKTTYAPEPPLASPPWRAGGICKGGRAGFPLDFRPAASAWRDVAPRGSHTAAKWSHSHLGLWPLQHHDGSLPLYKPSPIRSRAPRQEARAPGHASARLALARSRRHKLRGRTPSTQAREQRIHPRELKESQGSFPERERRGAQGKLHRAQGMHWRAEAEL